MFFSEPPSGTQTPPCGPVIRRSACCACAGAAQHSSAARQVEEISRCSGTMRMVKLLVRAEGPHQYARSGANPTLVLSSTNLAVTHEALGASRAGSKMRAHPQPGETA